MQAPPAGFARAERNSELLEDKNRCSGASSDELTSQSGSSQLFAFCCAPLTFRPQVLNYAAFP
jgi:hypothetical protein